MKVRVAEERIGLCSHGIGCPETDKKLVAQKWADSETMCPPCYMFLSYWPDETTAVAALAICLSGCEGAVKYSFTPHSASSIVET